MVDSSAILNQSFHKTFLTKTDEDGRDGGDKVDGGWLPWALIAVMGTKDEPPQDDEGCSL